MKNKTYLGMTVNVFHKGELIDPISASVNADGKNEAVVLWDPDKHPVTDEVRNQLSTACEKPVTITLTNDIVITFTEQPK